MLFRNPSRRVFSPDQLDQRFKAGLIGHWLGGGSGNTWIDQSGYGRHGSFVGGVTWNLGVEGKRNAIRVNGVDGSRATIPTVTMSGAKSVSFWIKLYSDHIATVATIIGSGSGTTIIDCFPAISSILLYVFAGGVGTSIAHTMGLNTWCHFALSGDGTNPINVYKSGVLLGTVLQVNPVLLNIGGGNDALAIDGVIDDLRIYNRALSAAEIAVLASPSFTPIVQPPRFVIKEPATIHTATIALSSQPSTLSSSLEFDTPVYTSSVSLTGGASTLSSSASFAPGTKTATGTLLGGSSTLSSSVTHVTPTYLASVALNALGSVLGASATFSPGTKTAGVSLTGTSSTLAASGSHVTPVYTGTAALSGGATTLASSDTFAPGTKTATVGLTGGSSSLTANLTNTNPVYSVTVSLSGTRSSLVASGTFGAGGPKTASVALLGGLTSLTVSATFSPGTKTASVGLLGQNSFLATTVIFSAGTDTASVGLTGSSTLLNSTNTFVAAGAKLINLRRKAVLR